MKNHLLNRVKFIFALFFVVSCAIAQTTTETFDSPLNLSPTGWFQDRYQPENFENAILGGQNVLRIYVDPSDSAQNRPAQYSAPFYNTQGMKHNLPVGVTSISVDLYIGANWATQQVSTGLWATGRDAAGNTSSYPIIGFANIDSATPVLRYWDSQAGVYTNLAIPVNYGNFVNIAFSLSNGNIVYKVNGNVVASVSSNQTINFKDVIINTTNFNDSTQSYNPPTPTGYEVFYDNLVYSIPLPPIQNTTQGTGFTSLQAAINAANPHDHITVANGTYSSTTQININKPLTLVGESETGTIINLSGLTSPNADAFKVNADSITMRNFTIIPVPNSVTNAGYTLKVGQGMPSRTNIEIENITIVGGRKSAFDVNGADHITLTDLTANNTSNGVGLALSGVEYATVTGFSGSNNAWGAIAVYTSVPAGRASSHITIEGNSLNVNGAVFAQNNFTANLYNSDIVVNDWDYEVYNTGWRPGAGEYTHYASDSANAYAIASFLNNPGAPYVTNTTSAAKNKSTGHWEVMNGLKIQAAINAAAPGNTVNIGPGTFNESFNVNKLLVVNGSGNGSNASEDTIINGPGVVGVTLGSGVDSSQRVVLNNMYVTGFTTGVQASSYNSITNISSSGNTTNGILLSALNDLNIENSKFNSNSQGLKIPSTLSVTNLAIDGSEFNNNTLFGWYVDSNSSLEPVLDNVSVSNTSFNNNAKKGFYVERLSNALFDNIIVQNSGVNPTYELNNGIDINLKWRSYENITIQNSSITGCGSYGTTALATFPAAVTIKARNDGSTYSANPASLNNVSILNCTIQGVENAIRFGEAGQVNAGPTNVTVSGSKITGSNTAGTTGFAIINQTSAGINAALNYWQSNSPNFSTLNLGNNITFCPFYTTEDLDNTDCNLPVKNITQDTYYQTISSAITAAQNGNTIEVAAGSYTEDITVNKSLILKGANSGVSNVQDRGAETRLENCKVTFSASTTSTFDGFYIHQTNNTNDVVSITSSSNATVQNNIFEREGAATGIVARAVLIHSGATGAINISNNLFRGDDSNNLFGQHRSWNTGIWSNGGTNTTIANNTFTKLRTGVNCDDFSAGVTLTGNTFEDNGTHISFGGVTPTNGSYTLGSNEFGSTRSALINLSNVNVNFRLNVTSSTFGGEPASVKDLAGQFSIEAGMYHKERSGRKGLVKFVPNKVFVVNSIGSKLQDGVNYAAANDTIYASEGTYTESLNINKSVTLTGQNPLTTIVRSASLADNTVFITANNVKFGGFTVTRNVPTESDWLGATGGTTGVIMGQNLSGIAINNVIVKRNRNGIYWQKSQVSVTNSLIEENRTGINVGNNISGSNINGNIIRNNTTHGVYLNNDFSESLNLTNVTISNNSITGNYYSQLSLGNNTNKPIIGTPTATCNWFGSTSPSINAVATTEPGYTSQTGLHFYGGTQPTASVDSDLCGLGIFNVLVTPFTNNGTNTATGLGFAALQNTCNGIIIPKTKLVQQSCGVYNIGLNSTLNIIPVNEAELYRIELSGGALSTPVLNQTPNSSFSLSAFGLGSSLLGQELHVRVVARINGQWGEYGDSCSVFTISSATTQLANGSCNATGLVLSSVISAVPVDNAVQYQFELSGNGITPVVVTSPDINVSLNEFGLGNSMYGFGYSVKVRARVEGLWGNYGTSCTINTILPSTSLTETSCGAYNIGLNTVLNITPIAAADRYQIELSGSSLSSPVTIEKPTSSFSLSNFGGVGLLNNQFSVRVKARIAGQWGEYGSSCTIYSMSDATSQLAPGSCNASALGLSSVISAVVVNNAQSYDFELSAPLESTVVVTSADANVTLSEFGLGNNMYGKEFNVRIRVRVGGLYGNYGTSCTINTIVPATALTESSCGAYNLGLNSSISINPVSNANRYRIELSGTSLVTPIVIETVNTSFTLSNFGGITLLNKEYAVRVQARIGIQWSQYGSSCAIYSMSDATTQLAVGSCNASALGLSSVISAVVVNNAQLYDFELSGTTLTNPVTVTSTDANVTLSEFGLGNNMSGKDFNVRIRVRVGGLYGNYGNSCTINTTLPPTTLTESSCGAYNIGLNTAINIEPVAAANRYRIELSGGALSVPAIIETPYTTFSLSSFGGISLLNQTYSVRIQARTGINWSDYGSSCNINSLSSEISKLNSVSCGATGLFLTSVITAETVTGAQQYQFELTGNTISPVTIVSTDANVTLSEFGIGNNLYNNTFSVRVKVRVGGLYGNYRDTCSVSGFTVPSTSLAVGSCGSTDVKIKTVLSITPVVSAELYEIKISGGHLGSGSVSYTTPVPSTKLSSFFVAAVINAQQYIIEVRVRINGVWGPWGSPCTVSTTGYGTSRTANDDTQTQNSITEIKVYPVPAATNLYIKIPYKDDYVINMFDVNGRLVIEKNISAEESVSDVNFDVSNLQAGTYLLRITNSGETVNKSVIINR